MAAVLQVSSGGSALAQAGVSSEYEVKAAFLYHFAQFVEWPDGAFRNPNSPYVYCTFGLDVFRGALDSTLKGKVAGGRGFEVRHLMRLQDAQGCNLLFIGEAQGRQLPEALLVLREKPVLVVGESENFVRDGGMIGFSLEDSKVRFEVNLDAVEKSKLKISAKLLALAKTVIGGPKRSG